MAWSTISIENAELYIVKTKNRGAFVETFCPLVDFWSAKSGYSGNSAIFAAVKFKSKKYESKDPLSRIDDVVC